MIFFYLFIPFIHTLEDVPTIKLNNGVDLPLISLGTWQYNDSTATEAIKQGFSVGFDAIDTAFDYRNAKGIVEGLKYKPSGLNAFVTTKVPGCTGLTPNSCYDFTKSHLQTEYSSLGLSKLDLVLVHYPPMLPPKCSCTRILGQWKAMEEFYAAGKTRAIGVSNYCISCLECWKNTNYTIPAVNQVQFHVGMGPDPGGLISYSNKMGVTTQAYSPLGNGTPELITGNLTTAIGKTHGKSGVQVALRYIVQSRIPLVAKSSNVKHLADDIDIFSWELTDDEMTTLHAASSPAAKPSFLCSK